MAQPQPLSAPCRARQWGHRVDAEAAVCVRECLGLGKLLEPLSSPLLSPWRRRALVQPPKPGTAASGCICCSALALLPASLALPADGKGTVLWGQGVGGEGQGRGQLYLELHMPCSIAFGSASPPLPTWQLGSVWTHASRKQMPFQPLKGCSRVGGWRNRGCRGDKDSPKPLPWDRRGLLHPCCGRSWDRVEVQPWPWGD